MTSLNDAYNLQADLQKTVFGYDFQNMSDPERIEFIKWNILALTDELHEALRETSWKPWSSQRHINSEAFVDELIDALHFLFNLFLVMGLTPQHIGGKFLDKNVLNRVRQERGY